MSEKKPSSREKIVSSAISLFSSQGITATTTKEIAEKAGVNEVTLFRQFGSKQGLLLAVIQEASVLEAMKVALTNIEANSEPITAYGTAGLALLGRVPELLRSLIGESGQFPTENRQALGKAIQQSNQQTVDYLLNAQVNVPGLDINEVATLLNTLILGHEVIQSVSDDAMLWTSDSDFLSAIEKIFVLQDTAKGANAFSPQSTLAEATPDFNPELSPDSLPVADLPAELVRSLFQKAKKQGPQEYALIYLLFGAGLRIEECAGLMRSQILASKNQHLLMITGNNARQVPVNRWIMGNRYGTYLKNPLSQWLKTRQDDNPKVFVAAEGPPLSTEALHALWQAIAEDAITATGEPPMPFQARQTWCIELLMKGISLENLSILSGLSLSALAPYEKRAKEKAALEQAISIDQKS
ncbi:MAG: TetR family transcriptional regulator [Cyanobacteria bacterium J06632_3]